jgi:uncharacterized OsmC-like protein
MTMQDIAAAMQCVESALHRHPAFAMQDDAPATARWHGGMRVVSSHANGKSVATDLGTDLGGTGDQVSPAWLMRAGLASCAATSIVMSAAAAGIDLATLEVIARSRSDARGLLGMTGDDGAAINPAPSQMQLVVRIGARGVSGEKLRSLVEESQRRSPVPRALQCAMPIELSIEIEAA